MKRRDFQKIQCNSSAIDNHQFNKIFTVDTIDFCLKCKCLKNLIFK